MNIDFIIPLHELATQIHQFNVDKGWWDEYLEDKTKRFDTSMMLVISELLEAMEGCRKDAMDDKLPEYPMFDVELADAAIRLLDLAGAYEIENRIRKLQFKSRNSYFRRSTKPEQLFSAVQMMLRGLDISGKVYSGLIAVHCIADIHNIDLRAMIQAKMEYNDTRADHLRENRAKKGGKKF